MIAYSKLRTAVTSRRSSRTGVARAFLLASVSTVGLLTGIASAARTEAQTIDGRSWKITFVAGFNGSIPEDATLRFDASGGVSGIAGCNRLIGSYRQTGDVLSVVESGRTRRMCPPQIMAFEKAFTAALERAGSGGKVAGGEIVFSDKGEPLIVLK